MSLPNIFQKIQYIIDGYFNWIYDIIINNHEMSEKSKTRFEICNKCENNKNGICSLCGCILKAKIRVDFDIDENGKSIDGCPEKRW
jgi:hypothetical protein